jgi:hydrogenase maturation protease
VRIRVIGVGTRRGDDAAGLVVAEALAAGALPPHVVVRTCERPGADLLDALEGADAVVIIDATHSGRAPGTVRRVEPEEMARAQTLSSHALGVREVLALAEALGRRPPRVELVGIEAGSAGGDDLSDPVRASLAETLALVRALVDEIAGVAGPPT